MKYHVSFGIFVVLYETMRSRLPGHIQRKLDKRHYSLGATVFGIGQRITVTFFGHVKLTYDDYRAKVALIAIHL